MEDNDEEGKGLESKQDMEAVYTRDVEPVALEMTWDSNSHQPQATYIWTATGSPFLNTVDGTEQANIINGIF